MAKGVWFQTGSHENYGGESWNHIFITPGSRYVNGVPEMIKKMVLEAGPAESDERERVKRERESYPVPTGSLIHTLRFRG
jgi:hypothetical protein